MTVAPRNALFDQLSEHAADKQDAARAVANQATVDTAQADEIQALGDDNAILDEVIRQGFKAGVANLGTLQDLAKAQLRDEMKTTAKINPATIPAIRSVDIAAGRARLLEAKNGGQSGPAQENAGRSDPGPGGKAPPA